MKIHFKEDLNNCRFFLPHNKKSLFYKKLKKKVVSLTYIPEKNIKAKYMDSQKLILLNSQSQPHPYEKIYRFLYTYIFYIYTLSWFFILYYHFISKNPISYIFTNPLFFYGGFHLFFYCSTNSRYYSD